MSKHNKSRPPAMPLPLVKRVLQRLERRYARVLSRIDGVHGDRHKFTVGTWPATMYAPLNLVQVFDADALAPATVDAIGALPGGAVHPNRRAAFEWMEARGTRQPYSPHSPPGGAARASTSSTPRSRGYCSERPSNGALPIAVLRRLPEWAVYLDLQGLPVWGEDTMAVEGALVFYDARIVVGSPDLRESLGFLLLSRERDDESDDDLDIFPFQVPLIEGQCLEEAIALSWGGFDPDASADDLAAKRGDVALARRVLEPLLSLVLHLCSKDAAIGDGQHAPFKRVAKTLSSGRTVMLRPTEISE